MAFIETGAKAPDFQAIDQNGKTHTLSDYAGKNLILYFYPKDDTPGCTAEACDLRDHYQMWLDKGYAVVGVSPDSQASHQKFASKYELPFPLLADPDKSILKAYGAWGLKKMYGKEYEGVLRSTFVIDDNGIVTEVIDNVKTKEHTNQILKLIS